MRETLRSVRRIEFVSARPTPYSSCARGSWVCFPSSSSIVSFHIDRSFRDGTRRGATTLPSNAAGRQRRSPGRRGGPRSSAPARAALRRRRGAAHRRPSLLATFRLARICDPGRAWSITTWGAEPVTGPGRGAGPDGSRSLLRRRPLATRRSTRPARASIAPSAAFRRSAGAKVHLAFEQSAARALAKLRSGGADALDHRRPRRGRAASRRARRSRSSAASSASTTCRASSAATRRGSSSTASRAAPRWPSRRAASTSAAWSPAEGGRAAGRRSGSASPRPPPSAAGGKIALCLAGGGTEGLLYELGVLRALEQFLPRVPPRGRRHHLRHQRRRHPRRPARQRHRPDRDRRPASRGQSAALEPIRRRDLFDPNVGELGRRAARLSWEVARGKRSPLSALFRLPPAGLFAGEGLRALARAAVLARPA